MTTTTDDRRARFAAYLEDQNARGLAPYDFDGWAVSGEPAPAGQPGPAASPGAVRAAVPERGDDR